MKLKIERTINLEDAPSEAKQTLFSAIDQAIHVHTLVESLAKEADKEVLNTQALHERIHNVREALFEVDLTLSDADAILINYQSAKAEVAVQEKNLAEQEG